MPIRNTLRRDPLTAIPQPDPDPTWPGLTTTNTDPAAVEKFQRIYDTWARERTDPTLTRDGAPTITDLITRAYRPALTAYFAPRTNPTDINRLIEAFTRAFHIGRCALISGLVHHERIRPAVLAFTANYANLTTDIAEGDLTKTLTRHDVHLAVTMGLRLGATGYITSLLDPTLINHNDLFAAI